MLLNRLPEQPITFTKLTLFCLWNTASRYFYQTEIDFKSNLFTSLVQKSKKSCK